MKEPAAAKVKAIRNVASLRGMSLSQIIMNNGWSKYIPNEAPPTRRRNLLVFLMSDFSSPSILIIFFEIP